MRSSWHHGKPTDGFVEHTSSLEPVAPIGPDPRTPQERFFVCNAGDAPGSHTIGPLTVVDHRSHTRVVLDREALEELPQHHLTAWLECAGNGRRLFGEVAGLDVGLDDPKNTAWTLGALGSAAWSGPSLADVVRLAGIDGSSAFVAATGADRDNAEGEPIRMCLPGTKAWHPDTIVALAMNGDPLPRAHGAPARLLVPGWVGAYSIKWLDRIDLDDRWLGSFRADEYYVHRDGSGRPSGPITTSPVRSHLAVARPQRLIAGRHRLEGIARSGAGPIDAVDWRVDGAPWRPADLGDPAGPWGWTPFVVDVVLHPGRHVIETRATDRTGTTQPDAQPHHPAGVLWRAITPHEFLVKG